MVTPKKERVVHRTRTGTLPTFDAATGFWSDDWDAEAELLLTRLAGYYDAPSVSAVAVDAVVQELAYQVSVRAYARVTRLLEVLDGARLPLELAFAILGATQPRAAELPARAALLAAVAPRVDTAHADPRAILRLARLSKPTTREIP